LHYLLQAEESLSIGEHITFVGYSGQEKAVFNDYFSSNEVTADAREQKVLMMRALEMRDIWA